MEWLYWILGILAAVIVILILYIFAVRSHFSGLSYECEDKYAVVDLFLKKRYEMIPGLVETVQQYAAHETDVVENLIALRNEAVNAASLMQTCQIESRLTEAFAQLFQAAEHYQPLRISAVFMAQKNELRAIEQDIANAGEQYNRQAKQYNDYYDQALANIVATLFKLNKMALFTMDHFSIEE